jgi:hypothetical protein
MGVAFNMPLTDDFVALARSPQHSNRFLERYQTPDDVFERYIPYFEDELGLELVIKSSRYTRLSKMTTTYFREIRLGSRWPEYNDFQKASTLVHEAVHARQWRYYGRFRFGTWYLRRPRWRWAIEMHGYRESARWAVIHMHAAGSSTSRIEREVRRRASATTGILVNGYALGRVSRSDRMDWTNRIMLEEGYKQLELLAA